MSRPFPRPVCRRTRTSRHRTGSALATAALTLSLAACGSGGTTTATAPARATGSSGGAPTTSGRTDTAYARAVDALCRHTNAQIRGYLYAVQASTDAGDPDAADAISIPAVKQYIFNAGADLRDLAAVTPPARWAGFGAQVRAKVRTSAAAVTAERELLEGGVEPGEIERQQKLVTAVPFDNRTIPKDLMARAPRCRPEAAEQAYDPGP